MMAITGLMEYACIDEDNLQLARSHNSYPALLASLERDGQREPIIVSHSTLLPSPPYLQLHNGLHRLAAAVELGWENIEVAYLDHA